MNHDLKNTWNDTLEIIKISVSPAIFSTWFAQTHIIDVKDLGERVVVSIGCPTSYIKNFVETRYFGLIQDSLTKVLGKNPELDFQIKENPSKLHNDSKTPSPLFESEKEVDKDVYLSALQRAKIRTNFTFENFAVSGSNQMAHAAALAVSENLGSAYNPLFIWGGVGVGKSHLMGAAGNSAIKKNLDLKVLFCTGESFTNDIVQGIRNKTTQEFRNKYRKLDLLMIDDIQFIAGKDSVQEEFFHTFNAVTSEGGQIILTSDKPPSEISKLEERLRSRFEAGLIVDVAQPDFELRCAITQIKAKEKGLGINMEQAQMIAGNLDSARKIEGALIKLLNLAGGKRIDITNDMIEKIISHGVDIASIKVIRKEPSAVIDAVCDYYRVGKRSLLGDSRARQFARPRQVLMYILRTDLQIPLEEVGHLVGRDHSTVMHAVEKITQLNINDVNIREDISKIKLGI